MLRFGTDGVRGEAYTELTPEYVERLGRAAATVLGRGRWVVGRDPRESGPDLERALVHGLESEGASVTCAGVVPTPAVAHASTVWGVPAAVITASHNPYRDNGVKLFAAGGLKLTDDVERRIEDVLGATLARQPDTQVELGTPIDAVGESSIAAMYVDRIVGLLPPGCLSGLRLVVDCANGATSTVAPEVLARLGADLTVIHAAPDGRNINDGSGATAPGALADDVRRTAADLGLAFDGDGDRVIAVDHLGNVVDGDRLLALAALQLRDLGQLTADTVVVTVMSNLGFHRAMAAAGIGVVTTAVGDRYVLEALESGDFALGGEQSGHIIYRHLATTGDGLLAGALLARDVRDHQRPLAELAAEVMATFPQVLVNVRVAERHPHVADELAAEIAAAEAVLGADGRVLVRPSGTEPLVRVMVEAPTTALAEEVAAGLAAAARRRFA